MSNFLFNSIRIKKPKRNKFNLSHDVKLSMSMGQLVPIFCQDVVPGDTFKLNTEMLIRFAPLIAPVMHRMNVYTHFFFVPKRLVWDNWKSFITGGESGEEAPSYPRFRVSIANFKTGSLSDYLGFPVKDEGENGDGRLSDASTVDIDALPFKAYWLIYNEYYRDQNVMEEVDILKEENGLQLASDTKRLPLVLGPALRCWTKDYFTSALPFPQRGEEVELPLLGTADLFAKEPGSSILGKVPVTPDPNYPSVTSVYEDSSGTTSYTGEISSDDGVLVSADKQKLLRMSNSLGSSYISPEDIAARMGVDLSGVSSATINELRRAIRAQEYLEATARGGSRYIEYIRSIFGVKSSDARLQRPEYLGGGKAPVVISDVMQTSQTTDTSALATPGGSAASLGKSHSFKKYFEEFGYVIGIMSVLPVPCYQQGMPRQFMKFDRYDHYIPMFANLGEQEIKNGELYFTNDGKNDQLFGYAPRYAEYKYIPSSVHGDFRTSLKFWHMGRIFNQRPGLNANFLVSNPIDRIFALEDADYDKLWVNIHHNCVALRPMPKYGTPSL